jgi:membrane-associated protein
MSEVVDAFLSHDIKAFIEAIGIIGVYAVVFAESGLLVGFFLPGDSLLFTAGLMSSPLLGFFSVWPLVIGTWIAAVAGDNVGYEFGRRVGRKLFKRKKSLFFNPDNLIRAQEFYEEHGGKAIVLARFMPIVRTFAPIVAGIGKMDRKRFMIFNFFGGTFWTWGMVWAGYYLGSLIPDVDKYLLPIVALIILASITPPILHLYRENKKEWHEKVRERIYKFIKHKI